MKLLTNNEPVLQEVSAPVLEGEDISELLTAMWHLMDTWRGGPDNSYRSVGLAANQVGVAKRVITINAYGMVGEMLNPVIDKRSKNTFISEETCMSCPGLIVKIPRYKQITVEGWTKTWCPIKFKLRGFLAAVVQHEIDHLNGVTLATII